MKSRTSHHAATIGLFAVAVIVGGLALYAYMSYSGQINNNNQGLSGTQVVTVSGTSTFTGQQTTTLGYVCSGSAGNTQVSVTSTLPIRSTLTAASADGDLTTLVDNRFVAGTTNGLPSLIQQSDTGASTDGTAATGSYPFSIEKGWVGQVGASNAYPIWFNVAPTATTTTVAGIPVNLVAGATTPPNTVTFGSSITQGGMQVYSLGCYSPSTQIYNWNQVASPIQAPSSGTTATTNVEALVTSSSGTILTTAANTMPTSSIRWDAYLQLKEAYTGFGFPTAVYGTGTNQVTDYGGLSSATGGVGSYYQPVWVGSYLVITSNRTGIQVSLNAAAASLIPGATIVKITSNLLASGTSAWIVGPLPGCTPASGSTSASVKYNCIQVPIDIYQSSTQGTAHIGLGFTFIDNQQGGYLVANLVTPAQTAGYFQLRGSFAFSATTQPASWTGVTPTTGGNAGNPAVLASPDYHIIQTY